MQSCPIRYSLLVISFVLSIHASAEELPLFGEISKPGRDWVLDTKGEGSDGRGHTSWSWVVFTNSVSGDMMSFVAQTYGDEDRTITLSKLGWTSQATSDMFAAGGYPIHMEDRHRPEGSRWLFEDYFRWHVVDIGGHVIIDTPGGNTTRKSTLRKAFEYTTFYADQAKLQPNRMGHGYSIAFGNMLVYVQHTSSRPIPSYDAEAEALRLINIYEEKKLAEISAPDHIGALVDRLSETNGLWKNGLFPEINLPSGTPVEEIISQAIQKVSFDEGPIETFEIEETRWFELDSGRYDVALLDTNLGKKIFLYDRLGNDRWWTRFYDVEGDATQ